MINPVFENQDLAKAHGECLKIFAEYASRASEGKVRRKDNNMMFEDWMTKMRAAKRVPFGTAYELFAREAWNAAKEEAVKICDDRAERARTSTCSTIACACADRIRAL